MFQHGGTLSLPNGIPGMPIPKEQDVYSPDFYLKRYIIVIINNLKKWAQDNTESQNWVTKKWN